MAVLGIDTSCYRTSLAIVSEGAICADERRLLQVTAGARGLRQSEALFQHVGHLGEIAERVFEKAGAVRIEAVCASARPRPVEGSYMPVFTAGENTARCLASALNVPFFETSHQQGHLRAALVDSGFSPKGEFLSMHLSGGTTELLRCSGTLDNLTLLGGTTDLHAGQLVDRAGVLMGLGFPSGPMLEELAGDSPLMPKIPTAVKGLNVSLSGAENSIKRMIADHCPQEEAAAEVYSFLERTLAKWISNAVTETNLHEILIAGGVAASGRLRTALQARLKKRGTPVKIYWAKPFLSGDNAVGVALIGEEKLQSLTEKQKMTEEQK